MLREEPCQKLSEMITKHGRKVCEEKQRCKGLLLDYCHGYDKEINILLLVLATDIPAELLNTSSETSTELLLKRLIRKVRDKWSLVQKPKTLWGMGEFGDTPNPARGAAAPWTPNPSANKRTALHKNLPSMIILIYQR